MFDVFQSFTDTAYSLIAIKSSYTDSLMLLCLTRFSRQATQRAEARLGAKVSPVAPAADAPIIPVPKDWL